MSHRGEVLWRADRFSDEWFRHAVTRVTSKGVFVAFQRLDAIPRGEAVPRVIRVRKDVLDRDGFVSSSAFDGPLYTEAGMAKEIAWRLDPRTRPEFQGLRQSFAPQDGYSWPASAGEIRRMFRQLALKSHPDHGGSAHEFIALKQSYERALAYASE